MIFPLFLGAVGFAAAGYLGAVLAEAVCAGIQPHEDGPRPGKPPITWLVAACGVLGVVLVLQGEGPSKLALSAILCVSLVAVWCSDVRCGIIPDVFTLVPLAAVLLSAVLEREWWHLFAALIPFVPFAIAALASKGRGMGWGDVKLAALGGAVLGVGTAMLAFATACIVAVAVAWVRGRRTEPIAFGPYMVGAIGVALFMGFMP